MSSRMRVTKGHTGNRRSHHHIKEPRLSKCVNCGAYHLRHRVCPECGHYKGKLIIDVVAKQEARLKKLQTKTQADKIDKKSDADPDETNTIKEKASSKKNTKTTTDRKQEEKS